MKTIIEKHGEVTQTVIPQNFIYPDIPVSTYIFGSGEFAGEVLRQDGDWRNFLPPQELQRRNGIESSACFVQGLQHAYATIMEEKYNLVDGNFSERFNALLAGGTQVGGSPLKAGQSIRDDGMIPDEMLPFSDDIKDWNEFHSFKGQSESLCRYKGKEWRKQWNPTYEVAFTKETPVEIKYARIAERLKSSPMPVSVTAWFEKDGVYVKNPAMNDNHLVELVYVSPQGDPYIFDTYPPFVKKLERWFNFDLGMTVGIKRITPLPPQANVWYNILEAIKKYLLNILK